MLDLLVYLIMVAVFLLGWFWFWRIEHKSKHESNLSFREFADNRSWDQYWESEDGKRRFQQALQEWPELTELADERQRRLDEAYQEFVAERGYDESNRKWAVYHDLKQECDSKFGERLQSFRESLQSKEELRKSKDEWESAEKVRSQELRCIVDVSGVKAGSIRIDGRDAERDGKGNRASNEPPDAGGTSENGSDGCAPKTELPVSPRCMAHADAGDVTVYIDSFNQADLDRLIEEHPEQPVNLRIIGEWESVSIGRKTGVWLGDVQIDATVAGDVSISGTLTGNVSIGGTVGGGVSIAGTLTGNVSIGGTVGGNVSLSSRGVVSGNVQIDATVGDRVRINGRVTGNLWVGGTVGRYLVIDAKVGGDLGIDAWVGVGVCIDEYVGIGGNLRIDGTVGISVWIGKRATSQVHIAGDVWIGGKIGTSLEIGVGVWIGGNLRIDGSVGTGVWIDDKAVSVSICGTVAGGVRIVAAVTGRVRIDGKVTGSVSIGDKVYQ